MPLPETFSGLAALETLDLSSTRFLRRLPRGLGQLRKLETLDLGECVALETLPVSLSGLAGLRKLTLAGCTRLASLGPGFLALTGLQKLDLRGCTALSGIPQGFEFLKSLRELRVAGMNLSTIGLLRFLLRGVVSGLEIVWCDSFPFPSAANPVHIKENCVAGSNARLVYLWIVVQSAAGKFCGQGE